MTAEHTFNETGYVPCAHAAFVHLDDRLFQPAVSALVGLEHLGLVVPFTVSRHLQILQMTVFGMQIPLVISIAAVTYTHLLILHEVLNLSPHDGFQVVFDKRCDKIFK
ncbi:hypothetical protein D3C73_1407750 [compost metagenome]